MAKASIEPQDEVKIPAAKEVKGIPDSLIEFMSMRCFSVDAISSVRKNFEKDGYVKIDCAAWGEEGDK